MIVSVSIKVAEDSNAVNHVVIEQEVTDSDQIIKLATDAAEKVRASYMAR